MKVIIIGGVAGGASAAARLRRLDESAQIIILERGEYISYANCGLPYFIGGEIKEKRALTLQTPESFNSRFAVDVRILNEALSINPAEKTVEIVDLKKGVKYTESYDKLILSPGAEPLRPPLPGIDDPRIFTLRNIPDTYRIHDYINQHKPKTALVVGGGFIGLEMAENLINLGISVNLAEFSSHVIASFDFDMAVEVQHYARENGIDLMLGNGVKAFEPNESGIDVQLANCRITVDMVILSVGVRPESSLAKSAGLALSERGAIIVDEFLCSSDENIYAVGDAIQVKSSVSGADAYIPLAGPANKQGRIAAQNVLGKKLKYPGTQGSAILKFFDMTAANTGLNEEAAKTAGLDYDKVYLSSPSHATYYPGATTMSIKVIFEKGSGVILGGQIVGYEGVDKRIDVLAAAIGFNATASDLAELELSYAPPYSSAKDPINMAGFAIENLLDGLVKQYHWHDVEDLVKEKAQLIDVRTAAEYSYGYIEGAVNIPVNDLRSRLDEIDKSKPVYIYCRSGQRSYLAHRILCQQGFDSYHLAGGYAFYSSVTQGEPVCSKACFNPGACQPKQQ